jgi:hypothetical protein
LPYAFTEQGVVMLSSVLRSEKAVEVNIRIMRAFVAMRRYALTYNELAQKLALLEIRVEDVEAVLKLMEDENTIKADWENRQRIGFKK